MDHAPKSDRHQSIDALRGIAVLGIFAVNIFAMAYPWLAMSNPLLFPEAFNDAGRGVWTVMVGLFQFKFITIFSALFGAGIVLMLGEEKNREKLPIHRRRMFWLLMIGLFHCYILWYGDILVPYAVIGFFVAATRQWSARKLLIVAALFIVLNYGVFWLQDWSFQFLPPEELAEISNEMWAPPPEKLQEMIATYRSNLFARLPSTIEQSFLAQATQLAGLGFRIAGVMMIGMALFKSGFFTLQWSPVSYLALGVAGVAVGAFGSFWSANAAISVEFALLEVFPSQAALYWASLPQAFGYACLVMALFTIPGLRRLATPFAAAGRMALTNYLLSTIIGVGIFYGPPGLGLYASVPYETLPLYILGVWAFILVWSPIWLSMFRFGPAEWAWRSLAYGKPQPLRK